MPANEEMALNAWRLRELFSYDPETGNFTRLMQTANSVHVGDIAGSINAKGYQRIGVHHRQYSAHRLAWLYMTGEFPKGDIDDINMNRADNRWCNLREATRAQNVANTHAYVTNTSKFKGVVWHKRCRKWQAQIQISGKNKYLGLFEKPYIAYAAYCLAARRHFGLHVRLYDDDVMIGP